MWNNNYPKTKFPDCAIINYDETRICAGKSGNFVIENNKKERSNTLGVRASTLATLLIFIAADGSVVCDFIIVKGKIEKETENLIAEFVMERAIDHDTRSK